LRERNNAAVRKFRVRLRALKAYDDWINLPETIERHRIMFEKKETPKDIPNWQNEDTDHGCVGVIPSRMIIIHRAHSMNMHVYTNSHAVQQ
jgi:hypothetical protein